MLWLILTSPLTSATKTFNGSECVYQMLKAIWPSIVHIPNRLPESANISTVGKPFYSVLLCRIAQFYFRPDVLLLILVISVSADARFSSADSLPFHREVHHRTFCVAGDNDMVLCKSPRQDPSRIATRESEWKCTCLGVAECTK